MIAPGYPTDEPFAQLALSRQVGCPRLSRSKGRYPASPSEQTAASHTRSGRFGPALREREMSGV